MKRILGLDLGVNSIGWAVVNEAETHEETSSIIDMGVRVVPLSVDEKTNFEKGKAITTNVDRRIKRGMRRNLQRYKLRREELKEVLKGNGFISDDTILSENGNNTTFQTYELRAKSVENEISLEDFARVLLMINKKRGYKSNRKANNDEDGKLISGMDIAVHMYENNLTPGQVCLEILRTGKNKLPDFYKSDLEEEFSKIWERQKAFYPGMLTDSLKEEVKGLNSKQTFAVLAKNLEWIVNEKKWDGEKGESYYEDVKHTIQGIARNTKGREQKIENYAWRVKALNEKITPEQLLVVLQDINNQISASSGYLGRISDRSKTLVANNITVGQYLWHLIKTSPGASLKNLVFFRQDYLDEFNRIWDTQAKYHKELTPELKETIRDVVIFYQRRLKSQKNLVSICQFEQNNIVVEKDGKKTVKTVGRRVIPRSHPLYQMFRIWQTLNNIEVSVVELKSHRRKKIEGNTLFDDFEDRLDTVGRRNLNLDEMKILANELIVKESLSKKEILGLLFPNRKNLELNVGKVIGNLTLASIYKQCSEIVEAYGYMPVEFKHSAKDILKYLTDVFRSLNWNTDIFEAQLPVDVKEMEKTTAYKLWHLVYSYEDDNSTTGEGSLIRHIETLTGLPAEYASIMAQAHFEQDYGNLSAKAIGKILPFLMEGNVYSVACEYAGYNHSSSLTKEDNAKRELKAALSILPKNTLRNPVVEKILNQMVNVVNKLSEVYSNKGNDGPFDEIRVELARDLKKNAKEREELSKTIRENDAINADIKEKLKKDFDKKHISRNDIIRYKLYQELAPNGYHTLYSDTYIPYEKLFSKEFDIEHIIPQARLFDDSLSNKTLESRAINIEKGKQTAWDFVKQKYGEEGLVAYEARCNTAFKDKKAKLKKLKMSENEIPEGFIDRDLRNTQYISKQALSMLSEISRSVLATTGSITDVLRKDWNLMGILKELNLPKYEALDKVTVTTDNDQVYKDITGWTKRNDHRHHAVDALTVAFTKRAFIQYYNNRNAQFIEGDKEQSNIIALRKKYFEQGIANPPMPPAKLRAEAKKFLERILVSLKAKNKVTTKNSNKIRTKSGVVEQLTSVPRGSLHKETVYGVRQRYVTKLETVNGSFDTEKIAKVANKTYREALFGRLEQSGGDPKKAFTGKNSLDKNPLMVNEATGSFVPLKVKTVQLETYRTVRKAIDPGLSVNAVVDVAARRVLLKRLEKFNNEPKKAFINLDKDPILLNGKPLRKVTIEAPVDNGTFLRDKRDKDGKIILDEKGSPIPTDFVKFDGNHHAAIYRRPKRDAKGEIKKDASGNTVYEWTDVVVPFMEAVIRQNNPGMPLIDKNWGREEGWEFVLSIKKDEYFIFPDERTGFDPGKIDLLDPENKDLISPHLFRAQKFSSGDYFFRHHLETQIVDDSSLRDTTWKRISKLSQLDGMVKVRINHIGQIVEILD